MVVGLVREAGRAEPKAASVKLAESVVVGSVFVLQLTAASNSVAPVPLPSKLTTAACAKPVTKAIGASSRTQRRENRKRGRVVTRGTDEEIGVSINFPALWCIDPPPSK